MKPLNVFATAAFGLVMTGAAAAQEHGAAAHEKVEALPTLNQGVLTGVTALVVFAIVFAVLAAKVWPVICRGLDERASKIREEIAAAEAARKQAKEALEQYERSLSEARAEAAQMLEQTRKQQQVMAEELRAKADLELAAMRDRARKDIDTAKRAAIGEIYALAANAATSIAAKILQREVSSADQKRLIEESLGELQGAGAAG
jgi:F-type H+-transporting ATPase subunit b